MHMGVKLKFGGQGSGKQMGVDLKRMKGDIQ